MADPGKRRKSLEERTSQSFNPWLVKNLSMTITTSLLLLGMGAATGILTARSLGPEGKGQLAAVMIWPSMLAALGSMGVTEAVKYFTAAQAKKRKFVFANSMYFALSQSTILVGIGFLFIENIHKGSSADILLASKLFLSFIPLNLFNLYQHYFLGGRSDFGVFNFLRIFTSGCILAGIVALAAVGRMTVLNAVVVILVGNLATSLVQFLLALRTGEVGFEFSKTLALPMLGYGLKAHAENVGSTLNERLDQLMISIMLAPLQLGYYAVAVTLSSGVLLIGNSAAMVAMPAIASQGRSYDRKNAFIQCFRFSFWLSVACAVFLAAMMPGLTGLLFGEEFIPSVKVAQILAVAAILSSMNKVLQAGLKATNKPLKAGVAEFLGLGAALPLLLLLLPRLGIMGAAIASSTAYSVSFMYMLFMVIRHMGCRISELFTLKSNDLKFVTPTPGQGW